MRPFWRRSRIGWTGRPRPMTDSLVMGRWSAWATAAGHQPVMIVAPDPQHKKQIFSAPPVSRHLANFNVDWGYETPVLPAVTGNGPACALPRC